MKKIALSLVVAMFLLLLSVCVCAAEDVAVCAEISDISKGKLTVNIYGNDLKNLVALNVKVEYDDTVFSYENGSAAQHYDDEIGESVCNFNGMWEFGEVADGNGCASVLVAAQGSSHSGKTPLCSFTLRVTGKTVESSDISVTVCELVTDDYDYLNDVYSSVKIAEKSLAVSYEDFFMFEKTNGTVKLTECFYNADVTVVPEELADCAVCEIDCLQPISSAFAVIPDSVTDITQSSFSGNTVLICSYEGNVRRYADENAMKYAAYKNSYLDLQKMIITTAKTYIVSVDELFATTQNIVSVPSHDFATVLYGTKSTFDIINADKTFSLSLCVKGDLNGDSVCDVLDAVFEERASSRR